MQIRSSLKANQITKNRAAEAASKQTTNDNEASALSPKDLVTKGAFATGGAFAGVGLGVATGGVLATLTGNSTLTSVGGVLGAVAGAATAISVSDSENKGETLKTVGLGWAGASVGSGLGQLLSTATLGMAAQTLGYTTLAAAAPFIGTATGALVGATLPLAENKSEAAKMIKTGAKLAGLSSVGLTAGTAARMLAATTPGFEHMAMAAPFMGLAAGATLALAPDTELGKKAKVVALMAPAAYVGGNLLGAMAHNLGGSIGYTYALPAVFGTAGALIGMSFGDEKNLERDQKLATAGGSLLTGSAGAIIGDIVGQTVSSATGISLYQVAGPVLGSVTGLASVLSPNEGRLKNAGPALGFFSGALAAGGLGGAALTAISGNPIYNQMGSLVGAANGAVMGLGLLEVKTGHALPILMSTTAGVGIGAVAGEVLSAVSGNPFYKAVAPIAGALNGAALALDLDGVIDTKGVAEGITGMSAGVGVGVLLGASLDALTGQNIWTNSLPFLGGLAGGLSVAALKLNAAPAKVA